MLLGNSLLIIFGGWLVLHLIKLVIIKLAIGGLTFSAHQFSANQVTNHTNHNNQRYNAKHLPPLRLFSWLLLWNYGGHDRIWYFLWMPLWHDWIELMVRLRLSLSLILFLFWVYLRGRHRLWGSTTLRSCFGLIRHCYSLWLWLDVIYQE